MPVNNKRIAKNTVALYVRMLLLMAVSLYTSRVVLSALGVDDYGIYNLIGGFITLFSFISNSLVGAMQRFFNVALGHNDHKEYRSIYSMSYNIFVLFSVFLIVVGETVGLWFISTQLNIPSGRETATFWVYQFSLLTLIVHLLRTPDNASIIAHERMHFYAYISIIEALIKLGIVFLLSVMTSDKLILYVILYLIATLFINFIYYIYCRFKIQDCRYQLMWDSGLFKQLASFSGWHIITGGSRVAKAQGESFLLNYYYSVSVNAAFGVAAQVYNAVNLFLTNFQTAFKPQLVQTYASGEMQAHRLLINRSARLSFFLLLVIVVPITFNLENLLALWLKEVPQYTKEFCIFLLMAYLVDAVGAPLYVSVNATGHIRGMQTTMALILLLGLFFSFFFLSSGMIAYIVSIVTFFVHVCFLLCYIFYAYKNKIVLIANYMYDVIIPCIMVCFISSLLSFGFLTVKTERWEVLLICVLEAIWTAIVVYAIGLKQEERLLARNTIRQIIRRVNNRKSGF